MMIKRRNYPLTLISMLFSLLLMLLVNVNGVSAADRTEQANKLFLQAVDAGDLDTVQAMLNNGADINYTNGGETHCLSIAVYSRRSAKYTNYDVTRFLISRGADVNARFTGGISCNVKNTTPLMVALYNDSSSIRIIKLLIESGANIHAQDALGDSVLFHAVRSLHATELNEAGTSTDGKDVIAYLVSLGADPNQKNNQGITPFLYLMKVLPSEGINAKSGYLPLVKYMIQKGADPNLSLNGMKPIDIAFKANNIPVYQYLLALEKGAVPK